MAKLVEDDGDRHVQTTCLLILTLIASGVALFLLKPVLVPFVLAVFFTYCLAPVIDWQMRRLRFPRGAAIIGAAIVALLFLGLVGVVVGTSVSRMSKTLDVYQQRFKPLNQRIIHAPILERLGIKLPGPENGLFTIPEEAITYLVPTVLSETTTFASRGAVVLIFMIFILVGQKKRPRSQPDGLLAEIESRVKRYISQTVFFSILTGLLVTIVLGVLGVEFAGVFGFLAFLLNFIPSVGSIIATLLPVPIILLSPDMTVTAKVLAISIPSAMQFVLGVIQPRVQSTSLDLHPVVVLMALIFFGMIWGIVGAFLATPITAVFKIIFERIPATRPLAALLTGNLNAFAEPEAVVIVPVEHVHITTEQVADKDMARV